MRKSINSSCMQQSVTVVIKQTDSNMWPFKIQQLAIIWIFSLLYPKSNFISRCMNKYFSLIYSGSPGTSSAKRRISSKGVVVILIFCVMLTTIAFLASIACYFYRKDKFSGKPPILSSDKETSWNSRTNLISQRSASFPGYQVKVKSHFNPIAGNFSSIAKFLEVV